MKKSIPLLVLLGVGMISTACIYEDPIDESCTHYIELDASDGNNKQITEAVAYVYDAQGVLVGFLPTSVGVPWDVEVFRQYGTIQIVAWGNASGNNAPQSLPKPTLGSSITNHRVTQNPSSSGQGVVEPSDLFFGTLTIDFSKPQTDPQAVTRLLMNRVVSGLVITLRGVGGAFDGPTGSYALVVRHPYNALDVAGRPIGSPGAYQPRVQYDATTDQLTTDLMVALPTEPQGVVVELYSGGRLVYSTTLDSSGVLIGLKANQTQNVLVDFRRSMGINLVATPWGQAWIFEQFN